MVLFAGSGDWCFICRLETIFSSEIEKMEILLFFFWLSLTSNLQV